MNTIILIVVLVLLAPMFLRHLFAYIMLLIIWIQQLKLNNAIKKDFKQRDNKNNR